MVFLIYLQRKRFKGTVSVFSSEPFFKDDNADSQQYPYKLSVINCVSYIGMCI